VPEAFCPGRYDIAIGGCKVAGLSQHWRTCAAVMTATTAATLIVAQDPAPLVHIVNLFLRDRRQREPVHATRRQRRARHLPVRMATDDELLQDLGERIVRAWRAQSKSS